MHTARNLKVKTTIYYSVSVGLAAHFLCCRAPHMQCKHRKHTQICRNGTYKHFNKDKQTYSKTNKYTGDCVLVHNMTLLLLLISEWSGQNQKVEKTLFKV